MEPLQDPVMPNLYFEGRAPRFRCYCGELTQLAVRRGEGRSRPLGFEMGSLGTGVRESAGGPRFSSAG